jgi:FAD/FMN-containing dehydrogenase
MIELKSYTGRLRERAAEIRAPSSVAELCELVAAHDPARHGALTLRGHGHSLDRQALGKGVVVSLEALPHRVCVTEDDWITGASAADGRPLRWTTVEVTGWTPWEAVTRASLRLAQPAAWLRTADDSWVVDRYQPLPASPVGNHCSWRRGGANEAVNEAASEATNDAANEATKDVGPIARFVPYVMVSSGRITTGGSLSGDGMWRFSSVLGRESDSVVWFDLLRADGSIVRVFNARWNLWDHRSGHPGREPAPSKQQNDQWFDAVIGGFGLLGCIVNIKYLLLELDERLEHGAFRLSPPGAPQQASPRYPHPEREHRAFERRLQTLRARDAIALPSAAPAIQAQAQAEAPGWPRYPHAPEGELGKTGAEIDARALTWMWATDSAEALFDTLQHHRRAQIAREAERGRIAIPRRVTEHTVACFGLLFANSSHPMQGIIGNVAYGTPPDQADGFLLWDRHYGWKSAALILRWGLLPWAARIGEWFVYHHVFEACIDHSPTQNPIPEFGFFMEGHAIAQDEQAHRPCGVQQAWSIPIGLDGDEGRDVVARFLAALHRMSHQWRWLGNAVRVTVCDLKCLPPGRALLSSAPDSHVIVVTVTVENGRGYRRWLGWGSPARAFRRLTQRFVGDGVKVHLTKGVCARTADLRAMYGPRFRQFLALKRTLDPRGVWGSDMLDLIEAAAQ